MINIHISLSYSTYLRFLLLQRLDELRGKNVILLGDFNAAFDYQSQNYVPENDRYLKYLVTEYQYIELLSQGEEENPQYTFIDKKNNSKKLDHIFVSKTLYNIIKNTYTLRYIGEVKQCQKSIDHVGIELKLFIV